jgi:hypothetical protein
MESRPTAKAVTGARSVAGRVLGSLHRLPMAGASPSDLQRPSVRRNDRRDGCYP